MGSSSSIKVAGVKAIMHFKQVAFFIDYPFRVVLTIGSKSLIKKATRCRFAGVKVTFYASVVIFIFKPYL